MRPIQEPRPQGRPQAEPKDMDIMSNDAAALRGNWNYPTSVKFGCGRIKELADHCKALGMKRPLLITDPGLANLPMIKDAIARNEAAGLKTRLFSNIQGNPTGKNVEDGIAAYKAGGHDGVIAFGGGSALDAAKAVALMIGQKRPIWDFEDIGDWWTRVDPNGIAPIVGVPTTSGTGSEVGRSSVVSENDTHLKRVVFSPKILARCVFADPELTVGLPAAVTAATGIDALTHNVESYLSPAYHPLCDGIALEGTRIAARALLTAVNEPGNLQARSDMMMASMMGAIAFQKDLGAVHSCAHALGAVNDLHHGLANALMIDTVMAWNYEAVPAKFDELAHVCGVAGGGAQFVPWLRSLKASIGITGSLKSHGVTDAHLPRLVDIATRDICHQTNPRACTSSDFERLFRAAM